MSGEHARRVLAQLANVRRIPESGMPGTTRARTDALRITPAPEPAPPQASTTTAPKLLVVDDLPEICGIFKDVHRRLRSTRVELHTETNSQRALDLVKQEPFDVIVSDFRMRQVDGIEVLQQAYARHPAGYRILMTGYNEIPTTVERIRSANVDAYLQKPLHTQELLLMLMGFLRHDESLLRETRAHARAIEDQAEAASVALD